MFASEFISKGEKKGKTPIKKGYPASLRKRKEKKQRVREIPSSILP